jgi:hypothetical protein
VEEYFSQFGDTVARLTRQIADAINAADFRQAMQDNDALGRHELPPAMQLYVVCNRIRLAAYQSRRLEPFDVLEQIEQPFAELNRPGTWERQWYVLSWLTLPFACKYPIDIFYMHHLAQELPELVMRQRCLARAVRYGVQFKDHPYLAFVLEHPAAKMPEGGDPYYSALITFLLSTYQRHSGEMAGVIESLQRSAVTPLQEHSVKQLVAQYGHLWSD